MKTEQEIREKIKELDEKGWKIVCQEESFERTLKIGTNKIEIAMLRWILND